MKNKFKVLILVSLLALVITMGYSCSSDMTDANSPSVDRIVVGQVVSIDTIGEHSTLHFSNNLEVTVTTQSLNKFRVSNSFSSIWTYYLHYESSYLHFESSYIYSVVSVSHNLPDYNAK